METGEIVLAGGCFWGMQKYLSLLHGVVRTQAGYANGNTANPTYEQVCAGSGRRSVRMADIYTPQQLLQEFGIVKAKHIIEEVLQYQPELCSRKEA